MRRQGLLSATGLILLSLIVLMTLHEWEDRVPDFLTQREDTPLIIAEAVTARSFTIEGQLEYDLQAEKLTEMDLLGETLLEHPRLALHDTQRIWEVESQAGRVTDKGRHIRLTGAVAARHFGGQPMTLHTEELVYRSSQEQISAPGAVRITHPSGSTRAGAMEANLVTGELQLKNRVESHYDMPAS
ncbi:LPS export ABC transporter periplasmic protein LptC [Alcanivorax quisquiliarum]|uniref:LPS export ABC transporter periplasmic protein LptC n=1 Tax=Alcanivorax quisquiliarum TaxID=2933565 RepID=A0ABT0E8F1_9GAMM|nr:LPS export ABC transporter periplasmic protein LptC [Alcanivorax quisquiliarum]MCK0537897.1 LPS export ABC transporter periplasmic protein LptC [Alcanivorax quisquiliarum]